MVPVAGAMDAPRVLERRRIIVADPEILGSKQPYHAVAEMPYPRPGRSFGRRLNRRVGWRWRP